MVRTDFTYREANPTMDLGVRWKLHGDGRTPAPGAVVRPTNGSLAAHRGLGAPARGGDVRRILRSPVLRVWTPPRDHDVRRSQP